MSVNANVRLVRGQVYSPLIMKFAVKNPLKRRMSGASTNRTDSEKKICQPGRVSTGLDCELGVTTRRPLESLPSAKAKEGECPVEQRGKPCTGGDGLSGTKPCRWPGNCSERTHRRKHNETIRQSKMSYCGRALHDRPCSCGVQSPTASAPSLRRPFEYSCGEV